MIVEFNSSLVAPTLTELRSRCQDLGNRTPEYVDKQIHKLPAARIVDRMAFVLERCAGKVVLDIGASGPLHEGIVKVAKKCYGIDRPGVPIIHGAPVVVGVDLDKSPQDLPAYLDVELVVCGEVLEHLSNPGRFLDELRTDYRCSVIFTVPNAYSAIARKHAERGNENVNVDHVAWHSPRTLQTLLERAGYTVNEWFGYNGEWPVCEGLIAVAE